MMCSESLALLSAAIHFSVSNVARRLVSLSRASSSSNAATRMSWPGCTVPYLSGRWFVNVPKALSTPRNDLDDAS